MFRPSAFEKNLENATSHLRLEPDWPSILLICDAIRQNDISAKQAFAAIKKKMTSPNPHTAFYALLVLESVVKNCGTPMHEEISTKESCEMFSSFIENTPHDNVRAKMLELIQTWAYAFRSSNKYQAIKDTMTILKAKGHNFPELKEADAMFTADTAPNWADGKVCHRCRVEFTFTQRKHHCRNCGQIFCAQCSSKQCPLPKFGIEKEVRVCDGCYSQLQKPNQTKPRSSETDLPTEYLNSSLAQQSQSPPRKSDQELKEEEELQLAIALSQSEAEQKNKPSATHRLYQKSPSPEVPIVVSTQNTATPSFEESAPDSELAKYLNRNYWEQRKTNESPASPSAPSPMLQLNNTAQKLSGEDVEIDEFAINMKSQVEIFVNRMKSNSSRGRSISNDSSVQTLFMNLTSLHSRLLSYIKNMDDKRMWYEQLQDKLTQVKDSRAALDVLRQEHVEKLRRIAEEQERIRQLQMAHKLEIMRKKKQEYLQYQRQLALQRIQEQEREMQMRQEQQKAQYRMGQSTFPFMAGQPNSPSHQLNAGYGAFGYNANNSVSRFVSSNTMNVSQGAPQNIQANVPMPGMYSGTLAPISAQNQVMVNNPMQSIHVPAASQTQSGPSQHQINAVNNGNAIASQSHIAHGPAVLPSNVNPSLSSTVLNHGMTQNVGFVQNLQTVPVNSASANIPNISASLGIIVPANNSHQTAPQPIAVQSANAPLMQKSQHTDNDGNTVNTSIETVATQETENEKLEVKTAELISFD
uniref:Hepatocyte growth factor-regulated tyrosine kinase substrate n=1 Tax=Tabanus bromius TaxID=304241 RepID=A0A0K8TSJ0_TABBR